MNKTEYYYNKIMRKIINILYKTMSKNTRMGIYEKYETVADLAYQLPYTTHETRIKDLSMRLKK